MTSKKAIEDYRIVDVQSLRVDNFVVAFVTYASGLRGVGVSHCDKEDKFSMRKGVKLAIRRAQPLSNARANKLGLNSYSLMKLMRL